MALHILNGNNNNIIIISNENNNDNRSSWKMPPPEEIFELQALYHQEFTCYRTQDYIPRLQQEFRFRQQQQRPQEGNVPPVGAINQQWREKICEWQYQVVDHFHLKREIVNVAMNYLDRYLATIPYVDRSSFQLLSMTCLFLSIKMNHHRHLLIPGSRSTLESLLELSRGFFSTQDVERQELDLLRRLGWQVHPPTPQYFLETFNSMYLEQLELHEQHLRDLQLQEQSNPQIPHNPVPMMEGDHMDKREVLELAHFFVELATMDYFFVQHLPSQVALAAFVTAYRRQSLDPANDPSNMLPGFEDSPELQACCARLSQLHDQILLEETASPNRRGAATPNSSPATPGSESPVSVRMDT